jgi:hypothetical protein
MPIARLWDRFWFEPISPSSIAVFRMAFAVLSLLNALYFLPDFMTWFGSHGVTPLAAVGKLRTLLLTRLLVSLDPGDAFFWGILWLQIATSLTVLIGWQTRASLVLLWVTRLVLFHRNPYMWHQIDIFLRIYNFLLLFCPSGGALSLDEWLRRRDDPKARPRYFAPWGQRMIQLQMSLIYAEAFVGKLAGKTWLDGTAVYYATHFTDGMRHSVPPFMDHLWVYQALTYFTLAIELSLCLLVWIRPLRYPVLLAGTAFHLGIHWFLHLDLLELGAMLPFLCFLDPPDVDRWLGAAGRSIGRWRPERGASKAEGGANEA